MGKIIFYRNTTLMVRLSFNNGRDARIVDRTSSRGAIKGAKLNKKKRCYEISQRHVFIKRTNRRIKNMARLKDERLIYFQPLMLHTKPIYH